MTWVACLLLAAFAVTPVLLTMRGAKAGLHWRPAALALYRAQLVELDRELAEHRIAAADHKAAVLEVQRRLLAAAGAVEPATAHPGRREPVALAVVMVVAGALGLYSLGGRPNLPAHATIPARLEADAGLDEPAQLRQVLGRLDANADATRQSQIEQGDDAERRGDLAAAAAAWRKALIAGFDPVLAVRTADAESKVEGRIGFHAAALFRQALATVPYDAPWRAMVERRLVDAEATN